MAASGQLERDDSFLEAHRTSLLEVIEDKNRTLNKVYINTPYKHILTKPGGQTNRLKQNLFTVLMQIKWVGCS